MDYNKFCNTFNKFIFDKSKIDLLAKIADMPNRYIGIFRPTKPKAKIIQNLLQSHEIRFGDAFEAITTLYLSENGFNNLPKTLKNSIDDNLNIDQLFEKNGKYYFVEQKMRDDHDSTKKRGQIQNFEKKLEVLIAKYGETNVTGFFYFVDSDLNKNKKYYQAEIAKLEKSYNVELHLHYGKDFFAYFAIPNIWEEIIDYLRKWKNNIADFPEINFDIDAEETFEEIQKLPTASFRKLFENDEVFKEIILTVFPAKKTLFLLKDYFESKSSTKIYKTLHDLLKQKLDNIA